VSARVAELVEAIKEKGRRSARELPSLLEEAERLAHDRNADPLDQALAFRASANARQMMNEFDDALNAYDEAILRFEGLNQPEELGRTLHAKVGLLNFMCRYDELLICADRARSIFEALDDRRRLARLDANLSHVYNRLNRFDLVLEFSDRALQVLEAAADREGALVALTNSAVALMLLSDFEEAHRRYERALKLASEQGWPVAELSCRFNIAYLNFLRGASAAALDELSRLKPEYERAGDRRQLCQCWLNEAEILLEIGDVEGALGSARQAELLARALGLHLETGKALVFRSQAARGEHETLLSEAARCFQKERNNVWAAIAKLQLVTLQAAEDASEVLDEALAARRFLQDSRLPGRTAMADIVVGRIQRRLGDSASAMAAFQSALDSANFARSDWMQFHAAHELGATLAPSQPEVAEQHLRAAERKLDSLWSQLGSDDLKLAFLNDRENVYTPLVRLSAQRSAESAFEFSEKARSRVLQERLGVAPGRLATLANLLGEGEAVVEYFVDGPDILVFVLTSRGVRCIRLDDATAEVETLTANLDRHFASCSVAWERLAAASEHQRRTAEAHLSQLYRILLSRLEELLPQRIVFVPHGPLHRVPFQGLWNGEQFLVDAHEVVYSPSAALYCNPAPVNGSRSSLFVAFTSGESSSAEEEVLEAASGTRSSIVLIDPTIRELAEAFQSPHALVHIAGHAGVDPVAGNLSWIETAHGRLTQRDLSGLRMQARTVVITGCKTARRSLQPGDEWQGLMRSFYLAGAQSIVSAFWDIRDQTARRFASEFYSRAPLDSIVPAVSNAMKTVRQWQSHPYFWAGFCTFARKSRQEGV
jgi:tetratricopeptide (TPR) repeat protein